MNSNNENELNAVIKLVIDWDWKMSASGFFTLDRSLFSGVI